MQATVDRPAAAPAPTDTRPVLEAIARRVCLSATYNRQAVILAPHILYTRHGELHMDAVTVLRDGQPPREAKLGTYKLIGLHDLAVDDRPFDAFSGFAAGDPKYAGVTLFAL